MIGDLWEFLDGEQKNACFYEGKSPYGSSPTAGTVFSSGL